MIGGGLSARASNGLTSGGGVPADFGYRYASAERGVIDLIKHAKAEAPQRDLRLLGYLDTAPNTVKTAFAQVLRAQE